MALPTPWRMSEPAERTMFFCQFETVEFLLRYHWGLFPLRPSQLALVPLSIVFYPTLPSTSRFASTMSISTPELIHPVPLSWDLAIFQLFSLRTTLLTPVRPRLVILWYFRACSIVRRKEIPSRSGTFELFISVILSTWIFERLTRQPATSEVSHISGNICFPSDHSNFKRVW